MATRIRLIIAEDHALVRECFRLGLARYDDLEVVADVGRIDDLMPALAAQPCDVLLLDFQMDRNTLSDIPTLTRHTAVAVVTATENPEQALAAIRAGARAVVFKRLPMETLVAAIRIVAEGHVWVPPEVQSYVAAAQRRVGSDQVLTPREREIVRYVAFGLHNAEVGQRLFISVQTVKTHLNNIFQKLEVRDRVELTLYAARVGIIGVNEREAL